MTRPYVTGGAVALAVAAVFAAPNAQTPTPADDALAKKARAIHERVIALDTHDDIDVGNFTRRTQLHAGPRQPGQPAQDDRGRPRRRLLHRLRRPGPAHAEGYDNAYKQAIAKFDAIHRLTEKIAPDKIELALTAADVRRINKAGQESRAHRRRERLSARRRVDIARVKEFYERGARYMSLAHNGHSQLADSNTGEPNVWLYNGLSDARQAGHRRAEPRRHHGRPLAPVEAVEPAGDRAVQGAGHRVAFGRPRALQPQPESRRRAAAGDQEERRRRADGRVRELRQDACRRHLPSVRPRSSKLEADFGLPAGSLGRGGGGGGGRARPRRGAGAARRGGALAHAARRRQRAEAEKRLAEIDKQFPPPPRATVKDFVDHIDYAVKKIGIDHVGISSDFDGGGGIDGWNDASETFNVTLELVRRGYTEEQIGKIWSGNLLRVMEEVRQVAQKLQKQP